MSDPKILIVDDDSMSLALLEIILSDAGIRHVYKAFDGVEALELYEDALCDNPYSVVFLDISMPGMDGLDVLSRIRCMEDEADYRAIIIMATGDNTQETVIKSMVDLDADDHVGKPYNREEIYESLVRHGVISGT
jgi:CheY-like chemotaxis protein